MDQLSPKNMIEYKKNVVKDIRDTNKKNKKKNKEKTNLSLYEFHESLVSLDDKKSKLQNNREEIKKLERLKSNSEKKLDLEKDKVTKLKKDLQIFRQSQTNIEKDLQEAEKNVKIKVNNKDIARQRALEEKYHFDSMNTELQNLHSRKADTEDEGNK